MRRNPLMAATLLLAVACSHEGSSGPDHIDNAIATLVVNAPSTTIEVNQAIQLQVVARTSDHRVINDPAITWQSSAPRVATISDAGLVTAVGFGAVRITARSGDVSAELEFAVVEQPPAVIEITDPGAPMVVATEFPVDVTVRSSTSRVLPTGPVQWSSSDPAVLSVAPNGVVRAVAIGSATIAATARGLTTSKTFSSRPAALQITMPATSLGLLDSVRLDVFARDADGARIEPSPAVTWESSNPGVVRLNPDGWAVAMNVPFGFGVHQVPVIARAFGLETATLVTVGTVSSGQPAGVRMVHVASGLGPITLHTNGGQQATLDFLQVFEPATTSGALEVLVGGFPSTASAEWGQSYNGFLVPQTHLTLYAIGGPARAFLLPLWSDAPSVPAGQALFRVLMASDYAASYIGNNMYFLPPGAPINDFPNACYFDIGGQTAYMPRPATPFDIVLVSPPSFVLTPGNPGVEYARFRVTPAVDRATTYVITGTGPGNMQIQAFLDP